MRHGFITHSHYDHVEALPKSVAPSWGRTQRFEERAGRSAQSAGEFGSANQALCRRRPVTRRMGIPVSNWPGRAAGGRRR